MIQVDEPQRIQPVMRPGPAISQAGKPNNTANTNTNAVPMNDRAPEDPIVFASPPPAPFPRIFPGL
jgi:hypothetical protein